MGVVVDSGCSAQPVLGVFLKENDVNRLVLALVFVIPATVAVAAQQVSPGVWQTPKARENIARAKAMRECRAYGSCGQQRRR
jgi:hypothetical protein